MEEEIDKFYLPTEWTKGREECFLLKIRDDSMEDANITEGDYVLIERCQTAGNRDIVAVTLEEATLKRFIWGNMMPKNIDIRCFVILSATTFFLIFLPA